MDAHARVSKPTGYACLIKYTLIIDRSIMSQLLAKTVAIAVAKVLSLSLTTLPHRLQGNRHLRRPSKSSR